MAGVLDVGARGRTGCGFGAGCGAGRGASARTMSMLPLKYAPSSITMRAVRMSPTSFASLRISILSVGLHVAVDGAEHHDLTSLDAGRSPSVRTHREAVLLQFDGTFHFTIDGQVFAAENLAFHDHGLTEHGLSSTMGFDMRFGTAGVLGAWTLGFPPWQARMKSAAPMPA